MSYCRFENTSRDLMDCVEAINDGKTENLNSYETDGLETLLRLCKEIVDQEEHIEEVIEESREDN